MPPIGQLSGSCFNHNVFKWSLQVIMHAVDAYVYTTVNDVLAIDVCLHGVAINYHYNSYIDIAP